MLKRSVLLSISAAAAILFAAALFMLFPDRYAECVLEGVSLWAIGVLPSVFPFLFLTAILTRLKAFRKSAAVLSPIAGKLFHLSGEGGLCVIVSMLSGYPVGARTLFDLSEKGRLQKEELFRLACLASTSGPMFLVGVVGGAMFLSPKIGWLLLLSHFSAVILVGFFLRGAPIPQKQLSIPQEQEEPLLYNSLYSSVISILCVGGAIAVFNAFGQMLCDVLSFLPIGETGFAVLRGLLEMTKGCALLSASTTPLSVALCAFLITFGGFCVLTQQIAFLSRAGIKTLPFIGVKLLQAVLAALFAFALSAALL